MIQLIRALVIKLHRMVCLFFILCYISPLLAECSQKFSNRVKRQSFPSTKTWNDPLYVDQWYLEEESAHGIAKAWSKGYTGKDIKIVIIDYGVESAHSDLADNFDDAISINIDKSVVTSASGTRSAGVIAGKAANQNCGVGVAYEATFGSIKLPDDLQSLPELPTDAVQSFALKSFQNVTDIMLANWGTKDDATTFEGPETINSEILERQISSGRNGKGDIVVYPAGDGGTLGDTCAADGFATNINTFTINAVTSENQKPAYTEECTAIIASAYSSGGAKSLVTTDVNNACTTNYGGTKAAGSVAAGIFALVLHANPQLTHRDLQYLIVEHSNQRPLKDDPTWITNAAGFNYSSRFGFGLLDADAMVSKAKEMTESVSEQIWCLGFLPNVNLSLNESLTGSFTNNYNIEVNTDTVACSITKLEQISVNVLIEFERRGDIELTLTSPLGTAAVVLPARPMDTQKGVIEAVDWPLLSLATWGENPSGVWTLTVQNKGASDSTGFMLTPFLTLYGISESNEIEPTPTQSTTTEAKSSTETTGDTVETTTEAKSSSETTGDTVESTTEAKSSTETTGDTVESTTEAKSSSETTGDTVETTTPSGAPIAKPLLLCSVITGYLTYR